VDAFILKKRAALRKIGHFTEYAVFAALWWRALRGTLRSTRLRSPRRPSARQASTLGIGAIVLIASGLFAASDEFHQSLVPTRTASENDVVIDICGAIVAIAICWMIESGKQESRKWEFRDGPQSREGRGAERGSAQHQRRKRVP
jgi:VanZ family protein